MTIELRDYFAAKAMQALIQANSEVYVTDDGQFCSGDENGTLFAHSEMLPAEAYMIAQSMIEEKERIQDIYEFIKKKEFDKKQMGLDV